MTSGQTTPNVPEKPKGKTPLGGMLMPWASKTMLFAWIFFVIGGVFFVVAGSSEGAFGLAVLAAIFIVIAVVLGSRVAKRVGLKIAKEVDEKYEQNKMEKVAYIDQLKALAKQKNEGTLTQQEFEEKKTKILGITPEVRVQNQALLDKETDARRKDRNILMNTFYEEEVIKLTELKDSGVLTQEECEGKKNQLRLKYFKDD